MKLFDENEIERYTTWDWEGTLIAVTIGLLIAWILIDRVIGADNLIALFN